MAELKGDAPWEKSGGQSATFNEATKGISVYAAGPSPDLVAKYEWKEKTTGPQKGKFAYFKNGVQVSSPHPKEAHEAAAKTINQGKGPFAGLQVSKAPADYKQTQIEKGKQGVDYIGKVGTMSPGSWPIGDDVERRLGASTPTILQSAGSKWAKGLTAGELDAIRSYTGSGYSSLNEALHKGELSAYLKSKAGRIDAALAKAPKPPPPELVWRGSRLTSAYLETLSVGDVVGLKGFQSSTINPGTAKGWAGGGTVLEIKPSKGAYLRPISSHKSEYEYLLPHGAKYTLRGLKKVSTGGKGNFMTVVQLEMHQ